jgi:hypothetical protein
MTGEAARLLDHESMDVGALAVDDDEPQGADVPAV